MPKMPTDDEILAVAKELGYDEVTPSNRARFARVVLEMRKQDTQPDPSTPIFHHEQNTPAGLLVVEAWLQPHPTKENRT